MFFDIWIQNWLDSLAIFVSFWLELLAAFGFAL